MCMNTFFVDKIEKLREEYSELIEEIISLFEEDSFGSNDEEIDDLISRKNNILKEISLTELKISDDMKENYFSISVNYFTDEIQSLSELIKEFEEEDSFGSNDNVISFLVKCLKENKKSLKDIENKISNFNLSNSNRNNNSIVINNTNNQTQNISIEIQNLVNEVEKELKKTGNINKSKLRKVLEHGAKLTPLIIEKILKYL